MKRLICLMLFTMFFTSSCSITLKNDITNQNDNLSYIVDPYYERRDATIAKITTAIDKNDAKKIKELFAVSALLQDEDFDYNLALLCSFVQGPVVSAELKGSSGSESINYGHKKVMKEAWYIVRTEQDNYIFIIIECLEDTTNPDNVGVETLRVLREADKETYFASWDDVSIPGIFVGQ